MHTGVIFRRSSMRTDGETVVSGYQVEPETQEQVPQLHALPPSRHQVPLDLILQRIQPPRLPRRAQKYTQLGGPACTYTRPCMVLN